MENQEFVTPYTYKPEKGFFNLGRVLVEKVGYVSSQRRIDSLISAGIRLHQSREDQFDFNGNDEDETFYDPTRELDYDLSDASEAMKRLDASKREKKALKEASRASSEIEKEVVLESKTTE